MAETQTGATTTGVLGRLPAWPRKALNNSVIAAEQAYRKRSGLPLLTEEDMAALRAGVPMPWEQAEGSVPAAPQPPASPAATAPASAPPVAAPAPTPPVATPSAAPSAAAQELLKSGRKWSRSSIAAEQAYRKRQGLPALTDADVTLLLGEPAATAPTPAAASSAAALASPAAAKPATPAAPAAKTVPAAVSPVTREGTAVRYVGTPAVGTSKAASAAGVPSVGPENTEVNQTRRRLIWTCVAAFLTTWLLAFFRFFLPRTLFEPDTVFKIGYPSDYALGVDTKFQQKYRIWVDRTPDRLFVIYARCTHLGCTPDWKPAENKFKCPCHGSGYDSEGINFEGPAPRPMDRAHIDLAPDGQIVVDIGKLYSWPKGQKSQFDDSGAYIPV